MLEMQLPPATFHSRPGTPCVALQLSRIACAHSAPAPALCDRKRRRRMGNRNSNTARSMAQCVLTTVEEHCSSADPQCPVKGHLS